MPIASGPTIAATVASDYSADQIELIRAYVIHRAHQQLDLDKAAAQPK
jgi:hypothetical protein